MSNQTHILDEVKEVTPKQCASAAREGVSTRAERSRKRSLEAVIKPGPAFTKRVRDDGSTSRSPSIIRESRDPSCASQVESACLDPLTSRAPSVAGETRESEGSITDVELVLASGEASSSDSDSSTANDGTRTMPSSSKPRPARRVETRGRHAKNPENVGKFTAEARQERAMQKLRDRRTREAENILDPAVGLRHSNRLAQAQRDEETRFEEFKDSSVASITADLIEGIGQIRKAVQISTNLKGTVIKELWNVTSTMSAGLRALGHRAQAKGTNITEREGEQLRQENSQLKADLSRLRVECSTMKVEMVSLRAQLEDVLRARPASVPSPQPDRRDRRAKIRSFPIMDSSEEEMPEALTREILRDTPPSPPRPSSPPDPASRMTPGEIMPPVVRPALGGKRAVLEPSAPFVPKVDGEPSEFQRAIEAAMPQIMEQLRASMGSRGDGVGRVDGGCGVVGGGPLGTTGLGGAGIGGNGVGGRDVVKEYGEVQHQSSRSARPSLKGGAVAQNEGRPTPARQGGTKGKGKRKKKKGKGEDGGVGPGAAMLPPALPAPSFASIVRGGKTQRTAQKGPAVAGPVAGIAAAAAPGMRAKPVPGGAVGGGSTRAGSASQSVSQAPGTRRSRSETGWTLVAGRGRRGGDTKGSPQTQPRQAGRRRGAAPTLPAGGQGTKGGAPPGPRRQGGQDGGAPKSKAGKIKVPSSSAVVLSCATGNYAAAMREVKAKIVPRDLGIDSLRVRKALTGALILEVAGPEGSQKADSLATKMREVLADKEGVRVNRPVKRVDFRLRDLEESVTADEIVEAVTSITGCARTDVSVGGFSSSPRGLSTVRVSCPAAVTKRVMGLGRITIGWCSARVEMLADKPLLCFRCLEHGHVRQNCRGGADRSGVCFRCGGPGHHARECTGQLRCPVCSTEEKSVAHRLGGEACLATQRKKGSRGKKGVGKARAPPALPPGEKKKEGQGASVPAQPVSHEHVAIPDAVPVSRKRAASGLPVVEGEAPLEKRGPRVRSIEKANIKIAPPSVAACDPELPMEVAVMVERIAPTTEGVVPVTTPPTEVIPLEEAVAQLLNGD